MSFLIKFTQFVNKLFCVPINEDLNDAGIFTTDECAGYIVDRSTGNKCAIEDTAVFHEHENNVFHRKS